MNKIYYFLIVLAIAGCGVYETVDHRGVAGPQGPAGDSTDINLIRFTSDSSVCSSESGVLIQVLKVSLLTGISVVSQAVVCDGLNGQDGDVGPSGPAGQDGADAPASPYQVTQVIDPCGDAPNVFDEVILKMANGNLIASFSDNANGNNTRLSLLTQGNYVTTDGSSCHFSVSAGGTISW